MRLRQIKLAGFKSFVDPTNIEVPSQLVGVVGPNGCGKSNIIDAVRWVLGESKAAELRGESIQDVIFSGSDERKPAGRASVELLFDNALGRIGGQWSQYGEISVKRVLARDGQSNYLINGHVVRRRDIHDMFLGTGLGPRAYAIIGQGTIARIIEAKPEELRIFLEEAAGVSKYKERRRESEHRLSDTRENLTRVDDILRELNAQIDRLETQAEVAAKYRALEAERTGKQQMLWLVRRDEANAEGQRIGALLNTASVEIEQLGAQIRRDEAELERQRAERDQRADALRGAQAAYYESNSEVARIEAQIRFIDESREQLQGQLAINQAQREKAARQHEQAGRDLAQAQHEHGAAGEREEQLSQALTKLLEQLPLKEQALEQANAALDAARGEVAATRQAIEVAATRRRAAEDVLSSLSARHQRLIAEQAKLAAPDPSLIATLAQRLDNAQRDESQLAAQLADSERKLAALEAERPAAISAAADSAAQCARIDARRAAVQQVQARIESQQSVAPWLARRQLDQATRLWQRLRIESGWETAIEVVLREQVSARELKHFDQLDAWLGDPPNGKVAFYSIDDHPAHAASDSRAAAPAGCRGLAELVQVAEPKLAAIVAECLHGVFVAQSLADALARRAELPRGGRFIVREGHLIERGMVRWFAADQEADGFLLRQNELSGLDRELRAQRLLADEAKENAARIEALLTGERQIAGRLREQVNAALRAVATLRVDLERRRQEHANTDQARQRLALDLQEVSAQIKLHEDSLADLHSAAAEHDSRLPAQEQTLAQLRERCDHAQAALAMARETARQAEREAQEASFARRAAQERIDAHGRTLELSEAQMRAAAEQIAELQGKLDQLDPAGAKQLLQQALEARINREQSLSEARTAVDHVDTEVRQGEQSRAELDRALAPLREQISQFQLKAQAAQLAAEQNNASLQESGADEIRLREQFVTNAGATPKANWLQAEVSRIGNAINALGAVNLAALDELSTSRERKLFLDAQLADLTDAIQTLEDAIRRIDRETRAQLSATFDAVNDHFGKLFPKLFGGGEARLLLTGEEILDSGLQVMAQPPGKRNTTIHLLSGGEKALTATALVFALFQLNPAPFCLLDEVDAPLDDANTERYCDLVRTMSAETQFLFITHNKIAMELAEHLVGVTMQEKGVSRIVAVDLMAAAQMAKAA